MALVNLRRNIAARNRPPRWPFVVDDKTSLGSGLVSVYWFGGGKGVAPKNLASNAKTGDLSEVSGGPQAFPSNGQLVLSFADVIGTSQIGYSMPAGIDSFGGRFTIHAIVMRDSDTAISGAGKVQQVVVTRNSSDSSGFEFNLGNGFGVGADKNKPRLGIFDGSAATLNMWIDGVKQSSVNPADILLNNKQFYHITCTVDGMTAAGTGPRLFTQQNQTFNLNGGAICICMWDRILADDEITQLYDPPTRWSLYRELGRTLYFFPSAAGGSSIPVISSDYAIRRAS